LPRPLATFVLAGNINELNRQAWLKRTLASIPAGSRILDAGAGELRNRQHCRHLDYVSQDFCQYEGLSGGISDGLHSDSWDTSRVDLVSDICAIPEPDGAFDAILCSEVLEHVPEPTEALEEFARLLKPNGKLILTAPFASLVHFAPYHYCSGFSRYWYEYHLPRRGFRVDQLVPNGDWFALCEQELRRLGAMARQRNDWSWPFAYVLGALGFLYFKMRKGKRADDLACFGWHCVAVKCR
jgi:SAM-dependent methyltransferase